MKTKLSMVSKAKISLRRVWFGLNKLDREAGWYPRMLNSQKEKNKKEKKR